jgi:hypothetical protein
MLSFFSHIKFFEKASLMCDTHVKFLYLTPCDSFLHKNVVSKWKCLSHNVKIKVSNNYCTDYFSHTIPHIIGYLCPTWKWLPWEKYFTFEICSIMKNFFFRNHCMMCDTHVKFLYLTPCDSFLHKNVVSKWKCLSHNVKIMQKQTIKLGYTIGHCLRKVWTYQKGNQNL